MARVVRERRATRATVGRSARVVGRCPVAAGTGEDGVVKGGKEKAGKYRPFPRVDFPSPIQTFVGAHYLPSPSPFRAVHSLSHLPRAANLPNAHTEMAKDREVGGRERENVLSLDTTRFPCYLSKVNCSGAQRPRGKMTLWPSCSFPSFATLRGDTGRGRLSARRFATNH